MTRIVLTALCLVCGACSSGSGGTSTATAQAPTARGPATPPPVTTTSTSAAGQAELFIVPSGKVQGIVLFMHGVGGDERAVLHPSLAPTRRALSSAGYALASSVAHGDNLGNAVSLQDQVDLLADARAKVGDVPAYVLAFSMGGLDALGSAAQHSLPGLRALALLAPACDLRPYLAHSDLSDKISRAFGAPKGPALDAAVRERNPLTIPGEKFLGYRYLFWQSPSDRTVDKSRQSDPMLKVLTGAGVDARELPLTGDHGDFSALRPQDVVEFFQSSP